MVHISPYNFLISRPAGDWHKTDFETAVKEREGLWLRDGGPTDQEGEEYKEYLSKKCGMDDLIQVYQDAYDRYNAAE